MRLVFLIGLALFCNAVFAENMDEKFWTQINLNGTFPHAKELKYVLRSEIRLVNEAHGFETGIAGYAIGYQYLKGVSFWLGYQWDSQNQITRGHQQNRIWQQIVWDMIKNKRFSLSQRTRVEERWRESDSQTAWRLRERLLIKAENSISHSVNPLTWNEIFFNLNHPLWVNRSSINQNRYFLGIEILHNDHTMEIGYMNQYIPGDIRNTMSHVLLLNFNIQI